MKSFFKVSLFLVLFFLPLNLFAEQLVIVTDSNFKPFRFKDENGVLKGFDIDLWDAVAKFNHYDYKWSEMDFNGIIPAIQSKNADAAISAITITKQREKVVDFSHPYYDAGLALMVRAENDSIKNIEDLKSGLVATNLGSTSADFLSKKLSKKNIKLLQDTPSLFMALLSKDVDAVLFDLPPLFSFAKGPGKGKVKILKPYYQGESYGIAFPKGSPLREEVTNAVLKLMLDGTYDKIYQKWFEVK